ncbi:MAG: type VI secretion system tip protein VgrG [Sandaracinaceae bacterium]|nr:type VI secretion system tip protein VgrG [Sandaracinaceae bacterium]
MAESLRYRFESSALAGTLLRVESAQVAEALNEPYGIELVIVIDDPAADVATLIGSDGALTIDRDPLARRFCGIVREVFEGEHEFAEPHVRVRLSPALFMLSLRRDTRMFQEKSVPEILEAVLNEALGEYGREVKLELEATYPTREYCLQYQETDLDFVHRLMEEEGISYGFDHEGDVEVMVLRDRNSAFKRVVSLGDPLELHAHDAYVRDREPVVDFRLGHRHTTTSVALRDWDWTKSGNMIVEDKQEGKDALSRNRESYEHGRGRSLSLFGYSNPAYQENDAARQKEVRHQAHVAGGIVAQGVSRVINLAPGTTFDLVNHPSVGVDGEYLVTRVMHLSRPIPSSGGSSETPEPYQNRFECIPLSVEHRPKRRTRKPVIPSIQTAIVTGPSGEEIHTDEHGRIKVQFHWDRENPADDTSSCWVRCEQAWAGSGWGFWWLPRIGMEVVVHFTDGDPDRPLVTGCVYNGTNALPYPMPDEKTKSTIKSSSSLGGGGFNEFRFEDKAGSEEIYTHAQKDYNEVVEHDHTTLVHNDQTNTVDNDQTQTIHKTQTERVDANQEMSVGGNRTVHVEGNFDETVDGTETRHTAGDVTETFDANETRSIGAGVTEDIGADETRTVVGNQSETIGASHSQDIGAASTLVVGGSQSITAVGGITSTTPAAHNLVAVGGMSVTAPAGVTWVAPAGVQIIAPGGVTFIDGENGWFGQVIAEAEPHGKGNFGLKVEMGAAAFELFGAKVNTHVFHLALGAEHKEEDGAQSIGKTVNAETGTRVNILAVKVAG